MRFGVGLWTLQSTVFSPRHHVHAYRQLLEDAVHADDVGFDSLWLSEHHFFYDGYCPALLPVAAAALERTQRLRVATGMLLVPLQNPRRLRAAAHDVGRSAGGRLDLGIGLGYRDAEFDGKGVPRGERVARMVAALDVLSAEPGPFTVWVGAQSEVGVRRAGGRGLPILLSGALPLGLVRTLASAHRDAWEEAGRPGGQRPRVAALRNTWITDSARETEAVLDWYRASYVIYAGLGWAVAGGVEHAPMDFAGATDHALERVVETVVTGPAEAVAEGVLAAGRAGVDDVVLRIAIEGASQRAIHTMMERFAADVMPAFADAEERR
jgi:alkanesulfonate monooxygenase SsuD/methylene tetrahydromethanopterin reductase-like flavin-dependent oxidoreductase (luciferase family)